MRTHTFQDDDRGSRGIWRWMKYVVILAAIVALVIVVVRATSDDSGGATGHQRPSGAHDGQSQSFSEEQIARFVQCVREQGVDVRVSGGQMAPGPGVDPNGAEFQRALATCQARITGGGQPSGDEER